MIPHIETAGDKMSLPLTEEAFRSVHAVFNRTAAGGGASSRKEVSLQQGFHAGGHFILTPQMFAFNATAQKAFDLSDEASKRDQAQHWTDFLVAGATCSCSLVSCGAANTGRGCPIHRDTIALKEAAKAVSFDAENHALVVDLKTLRNAFDMWFEKYPMGITGRMCGDHALCMSACTYAGPSEATEPVLISYFEAYLEQVGQKLGWFDKFYEKKPESEKNGQSVGIVGAGPAGLMAAHQLLQAGYDVTIYEASDKVGGTVWHGVPHDKYNKDHLEHYRTLLEGQGATFQMQTRVGSDKLPVADFEQRHDAYIDATGIVDKPRALGIPGEGAKGVIPAMTYLEARNRYIDGMKQAIAGGETAEGYAAANPFEMSLKGKTVIVVGVGYTGFDCIRGALSDMCAGQPDVKDAFKGSKLRWVQRRMDGPELHDYPHAQTDDKTSPTFKMLEYAGQKGADVEQQFLREPAAIRTDDAGRITAIDYTKRVVRNPHVAEIDSKKADYGKESKPITEKFGPKEDVMVIVAAGYDVTKADKLQQQLGLVQHGEAAKDKNLHLPRVGWYVAGDAVKGRPNEVVHALNSAAECAAVIDRDLSVARAQGEKLSADQWRAQSELPVPDKKLTAMRDAGPRAQQLIQLSTKPPGTGIA
jgi:NADPH-dependent glutamate synthase beta subunit-like oxidoreductase